MISVCLAAYNGERYIGEQLRSILGQLGPEDEVVVSDDGSTDGTVAAVEALHDSRIRLVHHTERASYPHTFDYTTHNFEHALRHARGELIFLSDQDDVWLPGKVPLMTGALRDALLVVSDCRVTDAVLRVTHPSYFVFNGSRPGLWRNLAHNSFLGSCMAFRRELLDRALPFPRDSVPHDIWLGLLATRLGAVRFVPEPLMLYRRHDLAVSSAGARSPFSFAQKLRLRMTAVMHLYARLYGK